MHTHPHISLQNIKSICSYQFDTSIPGEIVLLWSAPLYRRDPEDTWRLRQQQVCGCKNLGSLIICLNLFQKMLLFSFCNVDLYIGIANFIYH